MQIFFSIVFWGVIAIVFSSIRQVNQYERGVKFTLGRFTGLVEPGWRLVFPIFQSMTKVDIRTKAVDVPDQLRKIMFLVALTRLFIIALLIPGRPFSKLRIFGSPFHSSHKPQCVMLSDSFL